MAENRESTILDVQLDAGRVAEDLQQLITRIAEMKRQQKELNDEIKAGNDVDGKYAEQLIRVKDQLAWTEKQAKGLSATTKLLNADTLTYSDSLNGERQKLADMQKAYDQLDASQRESEGGQKFLEAIQKQSEAVKELEASTGRAQRNVGNYPKAWESATPGLSKASKVLNALGVNMGDLQTKGAKAFAGLVQSVKSFGKAFITPPIVVITAVVSAIVLIFNKLKEAFQKNDDAMTALQKAFAVFKPIGEAVRAVFDALAVALGKVAEAAANVVSWIADKLSPAYSKAAKDAQDLVQAQDDLQEKERQYTENSAKRNRDVAKLRAEATDKERYSVQERRKMLQRAIDLEKANLAEEKKIKAEQLRIIEETAKRERDTSDETKNKIAAARAAMYQAEQNYYTGVRSLQKQLTSFDNEEKAAEKEKEREAQQRAKEQAAERKRQAEERKREAKERAAEAKRQADERKRQQEEAKKAEQAYQDWVIATRRETEDALLSLEKDGAEKQIKQAQIAGEREVEALRVKLSRLRAADEEARQRLQDLITATEAATAKRVQEIQIKADADAEALKRSNDRKRLEQGRKTALELAQIQADATADEYARLQRLTDDEVTVLYGTWENYESALLDAEKNAFEAREALAGTEYAMRQKRMENEYAERLQRIDDEYALAEVEYDHAREKYETLLAMDEEQKARLFENEEAYKAATIEAENEITAASENAIKTRIKSIGTLGNAFNDLANSLGEFADESKGAAVAQKAFAFTGILLNQAQAISEGALAIAKGVESAAGIPFPANIPAIISVTAQIAAMIAGVTSSISQAKSIFSQADADAGNYTGGGVVPGTSYTGDRLVAHVNSGEGIYTSGQANNLLQEIANNPARGGIDYGAMAEAMVAAVSAMPAPVMDYQEFKTFEQDVATYQEIAKI
jgi:hypothetical protein